MNALFSFVVHRRAWFLLAFTLLLLVSVFCIPLTQVNYDDTAYLPADSGTKAGLALMEREFGAGGAATAMLRGRDLAEILRVKAGIEAVEGVASAVWLDDLLLSATDGAASDLPEEKSLGYLLRLLDILPRDPETNLLSLGVFFQSEFTEEEQAEAAPLLEGLARRFGAAEFDLENMASGMSFEEMTAPLGEGYAAALEGLDEQLLRFYRDGNALITILFREDDYADATTDALRGIEALDGELLLSGNAASAFYSRRSQIKEIVRATALLVGMGLVILFLFSSAWLDPLLYLGTIVAAVILNMGSNYLFKNVSYLTQSVACILQMALSMDYSIFLLNRYKKERKAGLAPEEAMKEALLRACAPISASSVTTIACFVTVMFMRYRMGFDMGVVMAKGILLSLISVFFLLPGLIIRCDKALAKTEHKTFAFACKGLSRFVFAWRWPLVLLALALMIPSAIFSRRNEFVFGVSASQGADSPGHQNRQAIEAVFGSQEQLALLVPKSAEKEKRLAETLANLEGVESVSAWAQMEEAGFGELAPEALRMQLVGARDYDRVILLLNVPEEGDATKALLARVQAALDAEYGDESCYMLGNTAAAIDMEASTNDDFRRISLYSILAVALTVALAFRSLLMPVILVAVIEGAVFINMSIPYLMGEPMIFLGYMIISNILLGATIDYAILLASNYMEARTREGRREALRAAQRGSLRPILTSGSIFTVGGLVLALTSTFPTVQLLGYAILRGGVCSVLLTLLVLPAVLAIFDKPLHWRPLLKKRARRP